ncbi:MAG: OmpA family protein [Planctomycetales bacterium]|nr:OmpA family protein [Planctomycetales bacterium]
MEEDPPMGIPEWVVTFGDMMSLLLTFFIMLVSMSEIKQEEKFQAMVESMRRQFGHELSMESTSPGTHKARSSEFRVLSTQGRAKKLDTHKGGAPTKAPVGDHERVRIVRPGGDTAIGTVVFFEEGEFEINDEGKAVLDAEIEQLSGKPQKIEVRGHTSPQLGIQSNQPMDAMDLAYRRARSVMKYLIENHDIPPERIRPSTAGAWEPMYVSTDPEKTRKNPRVEVFLLDETAEKLSGTDEERAELTIPNTTSSEVGSANQ